MQIIAPYAPNSQLQVPARVNWSNPITRGLQFLAPLSPSSGLFDLVQNQRATRTGLGTAAHTSRGSYYNYSSSNYCDFPLVPKNITITTPTTVAWTQEARSTSGFCTVLAINVGTAGVNNYFLIYQSPTSGTYSFTAGPATSAGAHSWSTSVGFLQNNRYDKFVLTAAAGLNSTTASNWNLYRNGQLMTRGTSTDFLGVTTGGFRVGALLSGGDPWKGIIGNLHIWSRVLTESEIKAWSSNEFMTLAPISRSVFVTDGAASGATGTVNYTNINDTLSASATTTILGTLSRTNNNDTSSASGATTILGTLARTNNNDTSSATGTTTVLGTLATTNANDTLAASGSVGSSITGTVNYTNANDTLSAAGTTIVVGTLARTNANDTSSAAGTTTVVGTLARTNANDTLSATGTAGTPTGTLNYTNNNDTLAAIGSTPEQDTVLGGDFSWFDKELERQNEKYREAKRRKEEKEQEIIQAKIKAQQLINEKKEIERENTLQAKRQAKALDREITAISGEIDILTNNLVELNKKLVLYDTALLEVILIDSDPFMAMTGA